MPDFPNPLDGSFELDTVYVHSTADLPGVAAANVFVALFNPAGSGEVVALTSVAVVCASLAPATATAPMRAWRITASSGGTLVAASAIAKRRSTQADPSAVVRVDNPTVTLGAAVASSPAVVATMEGDTSGHDAVTPLFLAPGEGICLRTDSGDVDQRWSLQLVWGERRG